MRHGKSFNHLGRTSSHRKALLKNLAVSLVINKRITTTLAKAKELRKYVEPLVTKSKSDTTHSRRVVFSYLQDKDAVNELFNNISAKVANRPGGYTRIIKLGNRLGDNAEICIIELVDFNEVYGTTATTKKASRRRKKASKKAEETAPVEAKIEDAVVVEETPVVEESKVEVADEPKDEANSEEKKDDSSKEDSKE